MTYAQRHYGDPTDIVGKRIGAWLIDLVIYLAIGTAIGLALGGSASDSKTRGESRRAAQQYCDGQKDEGATVCFVTEEGNGDYQGTTFEVGASSFWLPVHFVAYAVIQGITGASIGKLAVGLRVVTADGRRCGIGRSFLRTVLWVVDAVTCAIPILGGILLLSTKGHRRVGDMAAKTFVVTKEQEGHPVVIPGLTAEAWTPGYGPPAAGGWPAGPTAGAGWASGGQSTPSGTWAPSASDATVGSGDDGPTWDPARNAYIQYDRSQSAWVQWDDGAQAWGPISQ